MRNSDASALVLKREEFKINTMYAKWINGRYVVYSYGEHYPMFVWRNGIWYENRDKYSQTTTIHHSAARPKGTEIKRRTTIQLNYIIEVDQLSLKRS